MLTPVSNPCCACLVLLLPPFRPTRSKALAAQIGSHHLDINIDSLVGCVVALFTSITSRTPRFRVDGGSQAENLALQNIQVRAGEG